jgi:PTH1 family peptidyl-tRNA hydrolase
VAVHDDIDLPSGHIRIKVGGGHGGHNGVRSVIQHLGSPAFTRVKVGIGRPASGDVVGYVLGALSRQERTEFAQTISDAAEAVRVILAQGAPAAMNRFNRKVEREEAEP